MFSHTSKSRKLTKFTSHSQQMFYVCPLGDMMYVQAVVQFVPNVLEHHLVNGLYCNVDAFPQRYQCLLQWRYIDTVLKVPTEVEVT